MYLGHIHPSSSLPAAFSFFSLTYMCLYVCMYIFQCSCGSQRTTRGSWFSPFPCQAMSCSAGWPGTHSADDNDFKLIPQAPPPGNYRCSTNTKHCTISIVIQSEGRLPVALYV